MEPSEPPATRLLNVQRAIATAQARFNSATRAAPNVRLIAVSKTVPAAAIAPLLAAGQRVFAENRVQEAKAKWPGLRETYGDAEVHLIGPLQTNKVRDVVALFDCIQTLDRERLAVALAAEMARVGKALPLYVQVNIGGEAQKNGISPEATEAFVARCRDVHGLNICGLMCIPPEGLPPGPYFAHLASLARRANVIGLSMGMSADFEIGIAMGATDVRIGTALFGARQKVPLSSGGHGATNQ